MSSLVNALQSFIQWIYNNITAVTHIVQNMISWVNTFYTQYYAVYMSTVSPLWLQIVLTVGVTLMVGFIIVRLVVNLL